MGDSEELFREDGFHVSSDPIVLELNRLENHLKDNDRELGIAHAEIKALKVTERLKEKAVEELNDDLKKLDEKLRFTENLLEDKNLEIKKLVSERRDALAAQFAAEATLRRVHANQKDEDYIPLDAVLAPMESEIRMCRNEISVLQEDKKALERLTKSKELALLETERMLKIAIERALLVEDLQNQNLELKRQIDICQEENRILDKANRQKVAEVEKLSQTIHELEESILAGGAAANAVRDYQRQILEMNEERRTLERELARVKILANRVATVVANEWKDDNDKVMPVKQWLEERKVLQGEIQRLRDKLNVSERTAKAESQLKDKFKLRLKTLEEGLKQVTTSSPNTEGSHLKQTVKPEPVLGYLSSNMGPRKRSQSQPRASFNAEQSTVQQRPNVTSENSNSNRTLEHVNSLKYKYISGKNLVKKNLWAPRNKLVDDVGKENSERKEDVGLEEFASVGPEVSKDFSAEAHSMQSTPEKDDLNVDCEDIVSGFLYDKLQKEVLNLRKSSQEKDGLLTAKDEEIKMLVKKIDTLTKAMETELKKMRRESASKERELTPRRVQKDPLHKSSTMIISKRAVKSVEVSCNSRG
ncbi:microtubule-associated protein 70-5 isoform X2 [Amborella trichopoda]|uniref:Microtubule-associated protein 70-5 n=1 Tax=Amborella trichopoda TaxID=13333 RepID=U5D677_AMBTC|nr:microtubule-associated protein 70-5 isoform X2 [Amborella trichopoda]ERN17745.1 hypothetical protein AMTR_s00047p00081310 [Amborella trichopoda]|eukprot:XP_006856278.1 microtubule-associated protein 70-5 isoform X2 [Amborella trichopoda]